jgi:hypothetical protein
MVIPGRVQDGVIILQGSVSLPEGTTVSVFYPGPAAAGQANPKRRVQLPLVPSEQPGTLNLTSDRVAELLEDDDLSG